MNQHTSPDSSPVGTRYSTHTAPASQPDARQPAGRPHFEQLHREHQSPPQQPGHHSQQDSARAAFASEPLRVRRTETNPSSPVASSTSHYSEDGASSSPNWPHCVLIRVPWPRPHREASLASTTLAVSDSHASGVVGRRLAKNTGSAQQATTSYRGASQATYQQSLREEDSFENESASSSTAAHSNYTTQSPLAQPAHAEYASDRHRAPHHESESESELRRIRASLPPTDESEATYLSTPRAHLLPVSPPPPALLSSPSASSSSFRSGIPPLSSASASASASSSTSPTLSPPRHPPHPNAPKTTTFESNTQAPSSAASSSSYITDAELRRVVRELNFDWRAVAERLHSTPEQCRAQFIGMAPASPSASVSNTSSSVRSSTHSTEHDAYLGGSSPERRLRAQETGGSRLASSPKRVSAAPPLLAQPVAMRSEFMPPSTLTGSSDRNETHSPNGSRTSDSTEALTHSAMESAFLSEFADELNISTEQL